MATNYEYQKKLILNGSTYYIAIPMLAVESLKLREIHAAKKTMVVEFRPRMKDIIVRRND